MAVAPHPPGPRGHPLFGTSRELHHDILGTLRDMLLRYGDALRLRFLPGQYAYLFTHPEHVRHVLHTQAGRYSKEVTPFQMLRRFEGNGLVTSEGELWKRQRKLMQPAFHRQHVFALAPVMTEAALRLCGRWKSRGANEIFDLHAEMTRLTLEIAGLTLFGIDISAEGNRVGRGVSQLSQFVAKAAMHPYFLWTIDLPLPRNLRLKKIMQASHDVVDSIIQRRRTHPDSETHDLLSLLLAARDEKTGEPMPDDQVRAEVHTLLNAGHDTSANALTWLFHILSQKPDVAMRVREEQAAVLNGTVPTIEDLDRLIYSRMVIEETLRLYPPVYGTIRKSEQEDVVGGYRVKPGCVIAIYPYFTHRHPDFWDEPEFFRPERFAAKAAANRHKHAYIPFGAGPRQCIAGGFAMMEMQLILATVLPRFNLSPATNGPVEPEPFITLRPRGGLPIRVRPLS